MSHLKGKMLAAFLLSVGFSSYPNILLGADDVLFSSELLESSHLNSTEQTTDTVVSEAISGNETETSTSTGSVNTAILGCSKGNMLSISIDNEDVLWTSSNDSIASILEDGTIHIQGTGECDLLCEEKGFTVKIRSSGDMGTSGSIIDMNYTSTPISSEPITVVDKTVDVQVVEVNSTVPVAENYIPEDFLVDENTSIDSGNIEATITEKGNYYVKDSTGQAEIVSAISPVINIYAFKGSVGQSTDIQLTNLGIPVTYESSNQDVATVDENGHVVLSGEGEAYISVKTENNELKCKISSVAPVVDTTEIKLKKGETGQIVVEKNYADLPIEYSVVEGDGSVTETGEVTVNNDYVIIRTTIAQYSFDKKFTCNTVREQFWEAMQPYIQQCLGTPYVFGGVTPGSGLDCSGYVSYVYRNVGLMSGRWTAQGFYNVATPTNDPQPGDLVFFHSTYDTYDFVTHIGIYAGNGEMYHSGDPNRKVSLSLAYWQQHLIGYGTMISDDMVFPY